MIGRLSGMTYDKEDKLLERKLEEGLKHVPNVSESQKSNLRMTILIKCNLKSKKEKQKADKEMRETASSTKNRAENKSSVTMRKRNQPSLARGEMSSSPVTSPLCNFEVNQNSSSSKNCTSSPRNMEDDLQTDTTNPELLSKTLNTVKKICVRDFGCAKRPS